MRLSIDILQSEGDSVLWKQSMPPGNKVPDWVLQRKLRKSPSSLEKDFLVRLPFFSGEGLLGAADGSFVKTPAWRGTVSLWPGTCNLIWTEILYKCQDWCAAGLLSNMPPKLNHTDSSSGVQAFRGGGLPWQVFLSQMKIIYYFVVLIFKTVHIHHYKKIYRKIRKGSKQAVHIRIIVNAW